MAAGIVVMSFLACMAYGLGLLEGAPRGTRPKTITFCFSFASGVAATVAFLTATGYLR